RVDDREQRRRAQRPPGGLSRALRELVELPLGRVAHRGALRATYSRPAPAATNSTPSTIPRGLPMTAIRTTRARPMRTISTEKMGVAVRRTSWGDGICVVLSLCGQGVEPPARHAGRRLD